MRDSISRQTTSRVGTALVIGAAILWGTTGTAQTFAPDGASAVSIGAARMLFGGAGLLVLSLLKRPRSIWGTFQLKVVPPALAMVGYQLFFFTAVRKTGIAVGTAVALGTGPVIAGTLGWIFLKELPVRAWFVATSLALLGVIFLMVLGRDIETDPTGVLLALGAGLSYASYVITTRSLVSELAPSAATTTTFSLAAVLLLPVLLVSNIDWLFTGRGVLVALHLGIVTTAIAYLMFSEGMTVTPVATATTLALAEPMTASLFATIVVGERLTLSSITGVTLILGGLVVLTLDAAARSRTSRR